METQTAPVLTDALARKTIRLAKRAIRKAKRGGTAWVNDTRLIVGTKAKPGIVIVRATREELRRLNSSQPPYRLLHEALLTTHFPDWKFVLGYKEQRESWMDEYDVIPIRVFLQATPITP